MPRLARGVVRLAGPLRRARAGLGARAVGRAGPGELAERVEDEGDALGALEEPEDADDRPPAEPPARPERGPRARRHLGPGRHAGRITRQRSGAMPRATRRSRWSRAWTMT